MPIKDDRNLLLFCIFCIKREARGLGEFLLGSQLTEQSRFSAFCGSYYYAMHRQVSLWTWNSMVADCGRYNEAAALIIPINRRSLVHVNRTTAPVATCAPCRAPFAFRLCSLCSCKKQLRAKQRQCTRQRAEKQAAPPAATCYITSSTARRKTPRAQQQRRMPQRAEAQALPRAAKLLEHSSSSTARRNGLKTSSTASSKTPRTPQQHRTRQRAEAQAVPRAAKHPWSNGKCPAHRKS